MNRLILIGNGFDLAHGLKTSYKDFIDWYWNGVLDQLKNRNIYSWSDELCSLKTTNVTLWDVFASCPDIINGNACAYSNFNTHISNWKNCHKGYPIIFNESSLIQNICESIETKGWADIESEYYNLLFKCGESYPAPIKVADLNKHMGLLQDKLVDYLTDVENNNNIVRNDKIYKKIYAPFNGRDISQTDFDLIREDIKYSCSDKVFTEIRGRLNFYENKGFVDSTKHNEYIDEGLEYKKEPSSRDEYPFIFRLPNNVMLLSFNYTNTACLYIPENNDGHFSVNYIHGKLENLDSVIFGYGDELDEKYKELQNKNDNKYLDNVKSIKYLESDNYRKVLQFIESAPFQVCIMGHSCGNSDRTLLNTIFEHKNCISIKPYYYRRSDGSDNYIEIVQNISRNFKDPKLMRDRVVNKYYCEPLT